MGLDFAQIATEVSEENWICARLGARIERHFLIDHKPVKLRQALDVELKRRI